MNQCSKQNDNANDLALQIEKGTDVIVFADKRFHRVKLKGNDFAESKNVKKSVR